MRKPSSRGASGSCTTTAKDWCPGAPRLIREEVRGCRRRRCALLEFDRDGRNWESPLAARQHFSCCATPHPFRLLVKPPSRLNRAALDTSLTRLDARSQAARSGLARGGLPTLTASLLLLRRRSALLSATPRTRLLAAVTRGLRRIGDPSCPALGHPFLRQGLVLLLIFHVRRLRWHGLRLLLGSWQSHTRSSHPHKRGMEILVLRALPRRHVQLTYPNLAGRTCKPRRPHHGTMSHGEFFRQ